jgi:hypothetical protein
MNKRRFLRFKSNTGSITAETAISISFLLVCGFVLIQTLTFVIQYHRLQTLAQESSRVAASLDDPAILEKNISQFLFNINPAIKVGFNWQESQVTVILQEPTSGLISHLREVVKTSATAPRWSG